MAAEVARGPRFALRGIRKSYGATVALDGVDLAVRPGEVCGLVGANGAGKSTLMAVLSGATPADAGTMELDGAPYRPRGPFEARRAGVAMIHQELSLAPHLTVMENVVLGMEPGARGFVSWKRTRTVAEQALLRVGHPEIDPAAVVSTLPPAAQQLVEIARAFAVGCRVLVLDEPTSSLGRADAERLFGLVRRLRDEGQAIVYISHFLEELRAVADRFVVLRDGRVAGEGDVASTGRDAIVSLMIGRRLAEMYPRSPRAAGEVLLEVDGLGTERATFALRRGEVLGIAGLLGAGRTELLRALFGLEPVRSGRVRLGAFTGPASPARRWREGMGLVSEDRKGEGLAGALAIADNLTLTALDRLGPGPFVVPGRRDAATARWIEALSIRCLGPAQPVSELSGGNQQKVALGRLLHHDVDVLLLDEPTRGIDVGSKEQIYALVDALVSGRSGAPRAVVLVSSDFGELLGACDRIAVMCRGRLGPARPVAELDEARLVAEAAGAA
ncbi:MAG: sugar ABC transporter ATP-binding protein [Vicinamibacteria bacterium]